MNKQDKGNGRRGIEWTDYTWNPVGGCKHQCRWTMPDGTEAECYAKTVAERVAQAAYPEGFSHHYWREDLLREPFKIKAPSRIFLDSMSDLMGHWVPAEEIEKVLDICRQADQHQFQLLTKNPRRLKDFKFPDNVWVGVSAPPTSMFDKPLTFIQQKRMVKMMMDVLSHISASVKWMSIEPLSFDIAPLLVDSPLQWAVIGAATNGIKTFQPKTEWVTNVLKVLDAQNTPVFFKGNLQWSEWREAFPAVKSPEVLAAALF